MRRTLIALALVACMLSLAPLAVAAAAPAPGGVTVPVVGTFTDALGGTGTFTGTFDIKQFKAVDGQIAAVGTLTGTLTNSLGQIVGTVLKTITAAVTVTQATCDILSLVLGPLDLDLLGLQVHLDKVVLTVTAQSGPGNLLGNLLCAVAHLLDTGGPLSQIINLLNQILGML